MQKSTSEKIVRTTDDIFVVITEEEERFRLTFNNSNSGTSEERRCTICSTLNRDKVFPHPALKVVICFNCLLKYDSTVFLVSKDGNDVNCRWCAEPAQKYTCVSCTCVFCKNCLMRNFGPHFVKGIVNETNWECLICNPKLLWRLRAECSRHMENADVWFASSNLKSCNETENGQSSINVSSGSSTSICELTTSRQSESENLVDGDSMIDNTNCSSSDNSKMSLSDPSQTNLSPTAQEEAFKQLQFILKHISLFGKLFLARTNDLDKNIIQKDKLQEHELVSQTFRKISTLCQKAVENLLDINTTVQKSYTNWVEKCIASSEHSNTTNNGYIENGTPCLEAERRNEFITHSEAGQFSNELQSKSSVNADSILQESFEALKRNLSIERKNSKKFNLSLTHNGENKKRRSEEEVSDTTTELFKNNENENLCANDNSFEPQNKFTVAGPQKSHVTKDDTNNLKCKSVVEKQTTSCKVYENRKEMCDSGNNDNDDSLTPETDNAHIDFTIKRNNSYSSDSQDTVVLELSEYNNAKDINLKSNNKDKYSENIITSSRCISQPSTSKCGEELSKTTENNDFIETVSSDQPKKDITFASSVSPKDRQCDVSATALTESINFINLQKNKEAGESSFNLSENIPKTHANCDVEHALDSEEREPTCSLENSQLMPDIDLDMQVEEVPNSSDIFIKQEIDTFSVFSYETEVLDESCIKSKATDADNFERALYESNFVDVNDRISSSSETDTETYISLTYKSDTETTEQIAYRQLCIDSSDFSREESESSDIDSDISDFYGTVMTKNESKSREMSLSVQKCESSTDSDYISAKLSEDPKLKQSFVLLENCIPKAKNISAEEQEELEINRLINLASLKRCARRSLSSRSSSSSRYRKRKRRRKLTKIETTSSDSESSADSELSLDILLKPGDSMSPSNSQHDDSTMFGMQSQDESDFQDMKSDDENKSPLSIKTQDTLKLSGDEDSLVCEDSSSQNNAEESKLDDSTIVLSDVDMENSQSPKSDHSKKSKPSKWRQSSLLRGTLELSDSDDTNDTSRKMSNQKDRERRYNEMPDEEFIEKMNKSPTHVTIIESDSDDLSESSSDCQFISEIEKQDSSDVNEEDCVGQLARKGRRNIKQVMSDDLLQEETKKADKEEEARKERIEMKHKSLETVLSQSDLKDDDIGLILDVDEKTMKPLVSVHPKLVSLLKPHQRSGIKFMWDICFESVKQYQTDSGAGCILAHCMGLGKTLQVVVLSHTLLTNEHMHVRHILIVVPLSTIYNWKSEFRVGLYSNNEPIGKEINVYTVTPSCAKEKEVDNWKSNGGVLLINYECFQQLAFGNLKKNNNDVNLSAHEKMFNALVKPGPDVVVCDEGHLLKNGRTSRFKKLCQVRTMRRIILTGTPMQNNLTEYYYMVSFVKPHLLGTYKEYTNRFMNPIQNGQYEDSGPDDIALMRKRSHILHKKLETTVQRYEVSELKQYLPEKVDYVLFVQLTHIQIELYRCYLNLVREATDTKLKQLFTNFHNLQCIWTHPGLLQKKIEIQKKKQQKEKTYEEDVIAGYDPDDVNYNFLYSSSLKECCPADVLTNIEYGSKMKILMTIIKECEAIGDKLLVFSSLHAELDIIEYFLKNRPDSPWTKNVEYFRMDGTVPPEARTKFCTMFNNPNNKHVKVFLLSHKVGGLGLNLMAANRVVLMDVSWNPAYDTQSVFRIYRFGQTKQCYIYRLVSMGTMEEVVYGRSITKLATAGRVVDEQQIDRHFKSDELQKMYRLKCDYDKVRPVLPLPVDRLLAKLLELYNPVIYKYHEHQSLLENIVDEKLNEEEMKLAWEELRREEELEERRRSTSFVLVVPPTVVTNLENMNKSRNSGCMDLNNMESCTNNLRTKYVPILPRDISQPKSPVPSTSTAGYQTTPINSEYNFTAVNNPAYSNTFLMNNDPVILTNRQQFYRQDHNSNSMANVEAPLNLSNNKSVHQHNAFSSSYTHGQKTPRYVQEYFLQNMKQNSNITSNNILLSSNTSGANTWSPSDTFENNVQIKPN